MYETIDMSQARRNGSAPPDPNSKISMKLRQYYDSVQEQEIPKRFLDLLEKLDEAEDAAKSGPDDAGGKAGADERS